MNQPQMDHIMQTGLGFWASKTLLSAVEIEIFTELAKKPGTVTELKARLRLHPRSALDFLDALVALNFLERRDGTYYNTPSTDLYLDKCKPSYIGGLLEMANNRLYSNWGLLTTALRTGKQQRETRDSPEDIFEHVYADTERLRVFLKAMTGISRSSNLAIARNFPWSEFKTAVDVGTAQGDLITQVALANPHITGIGFDLPVVGPIFGDYITENDLKDRVDFHPGSFFDSPIPKADVVLMGHILHDWDLEQKMLLIRKAYEALPAGGTSSSTKASSTTIAPRTPSASSLSLNMLIETPEALRPHRSRLHQLDGKKPASAPPRIEHLAGPDSMVIGIK